MVAFLKVVLKPLQSIAAIPSLAIAVAPTQITTLPSLTLEVAPLVGEAALKTARLVNSLALKAVLGEPREQETKSTLSF